MGTQLPFPKGHSPQFPVSVRCGQTTEATLCSVGSQLPLKGAQPHPILTYVYPGQTAGWIKMSLGTDVNLGTGDVVLDGVTAPLKGAQPPVFGSCLLWPKGWMHEDTTWYGSRRRTRPHCVRRGLGVAGTPSNTKSLRPRPTSIPSGILVHPAVWSQRTLAENWGLCLFRRGGWVPI